MWRYTAALVTILAAAGLAPCPAAELPETAIVIEVNRPQPPPDWALRERLLLTENSRATLLYFKKYWDERGYFKCRETWGIGKGSDDVLQATANFPLLYALGGDSALLDAYHLAYEGHLKQFSTEAVEAAPPWGIFHKGFVAYNDVHHHAEQYASFNQLTVADPNNSLFRRRMLRFAGFYLNQGLDPGCEPIYDYEHHIIRSGITGSRGALLEIQPEFWGFDWENIAKDRRRFEHWTNVKGDLPMNLGMTTFATNAFILSGDEKFRRWVLDYVGAWCDRAAANDGIFPANVGLNGKPGEHWGGKWWMHMHGTWRWFREIIGAAENATLLSNGDPKYMNAIRNQILALLDRAIEENGKKYPPATFDGKKWTGKLRFGRSLARLYLTQFNQDDLKLIEDEIARYGTPGKFDYRTDFFYFARDFAWIYYLLGRNPEFPDRMMDSDLDRIRRRMEQIRRDNSKDWERWTDSTHALMPASTHALMNLTCGALGQNLSKGMYPLLAEVWHYDPANGRPGLPPDVGALVDKITKDQVSLRLVNLCQSEPRTVVVRMGAYGENQCVSVRMRGRTTPVNANWFAVRLAPGCGDQLTLTLRRFVNQPRAGMPWQ